MSVSNDCNTYNEIVVVMKLGPLQRVGISDASKTRPPASNAYIELPHSQSMTRSGRHGGVADVFGISSVTR